MKLKEVFPLWYNEKKRFVKKSTISSYVLLFEKHINPIFGEKESINEKSVQNFVFSKLDENLGHKTIKDMLIVLKMIIKYGAKHNYFPFEDWKVKFPTTHERQELEVLSTLDYKKLIEYIRNNFTFRNYGILLCLQTGMRIGEVCALQWKDIDIENKIININKTIQRIYIIENGKKRTDLVIDSPKTKHSNRSIPIGTKNLQILKRLSFIVNPEHYILTNESKPTEPRTYRNYYNQFMKTIGMPKLKFHGLRHTFATRCVESNCDYKTVSVLLGHANISTTLNLYVHPTADQKRSTIQKMLKKFD